jgi:hypothetical protein
MGVEAELTMASARAELSRPLPWFGSPMSSADVERMYAICAGVKEGFELNMSEAAPATCAEAPDVPK